MENNKLQENHEDQDGSRYRNRTVSYRRPSRDYSQKINWTYELNKDLYECFVRSERSELGYMKRLKTLWDIKRPEYKHLTAKHLQEQASRIIKKNLIADVVINQPTNLDEETFQQALPLDPLTTIEKTTQNNDHNHESLDHMEETI